MLIPSFQQGLVTVSYRVCISTKLFSIPADISAPAEFHSPSTTPETLHHPRAQLTHSEDNLCKETCSCQFIHQYTALPSSSSNVNKTQSQLKSVSHMRGPIVKSTSQEERKGPSGPSLPATLRNYCLAHLHIHTVPAASCCLYQSTGVGRWSWYYEKGGFAGSPGGWLI